MHPRELLSEHGRTVAVMQPYLYPYAGYFRLLQAADVFVVLDDVQFPRRGRVHRCEVPGPSGGIEWLTLPIARAPRATEIRALRFAEDARALLDQRLRRMPWLREPRTRLAEQVLDHLGGELSTPLEFVERGLALVAGALELPATCIRSSTLDVDRTLRRQDYVIALAKAAGATRYVNAPGGRALYEPTGFAAAGLSLRFLEPYAGRFPYLLPALMSEEPAAIREDIVGTTRLSPEQLSEPAA